MSAPKILAYQLSLPVRWADMDINGHVNNARVIAKRSRIQSGGGTRDKQPISCRLGDGDDTRVR